MKKRKFGTAELDQQVAQRTAELAADSPVGKVLADSAPSIRVVDSAAAPRDLVEAATKLRPDAPARTAPAVAQKPIYNMTPDELQTAEIADAWLRFCHAQAAIRRRRCEAL